MMGKVKRTKQVTLYILPDLLKQIEEEGVKRRRKLGPTVIDILHEYFEKRENANIHPDVEHSTI
jgi:hypothetical protein